MNEINIFNEKYLNFFGYDDETIEFLHKIIYELGYTDDELSSQQAKKDTLLIIEELLKLNLIYVFRWGKNHAEMCKKTFTIKETIDYIDSIWFEGADYPDFFGMVMLGYQKWYMEKMKELGYIPFETDWKWFVKNKIGNLEQWIHENRPKEI